MEGIRMVQEAGKLELGAIAGKEYGVGLRVMD